MNFSIIIPVFNRPDEIDELLASLTLQTVKNFEVLVIEDGSSVPCEDICEKYSDQLTIRYYFKPNSGRSETRNYGMQRAGGDYFIIFDSDCIIPPAYFATVTGYLQHDYVDCFGGPDSADSSFSDIQKAINYSMTSFFTTGGIRGGTKQVDKFSPRSFNMGMSREVFEKVGGYKNMIGEDIDLSIRIKEAGFKTKLYKDAFVFHKRRVSLKKFFKQVKTFGKARVLLAHLHPGSLKIVHLLPMFFVLGMLGILIVSIFWPWALLLIAFFCLLVFTESLIRNKSLPVAFISILTSFIQLFGYGIGFMQELITRSSMKEKQENLYK